mmetsp:Transcript_158408/g.384729  ORF Transcript_158408/g.384729 Transcript_158408/m.384729 type:complete len:402 (+) Transcript_158408:399-1604(+)
MASACVGQWGAGVPATAGGAFLEDSPAKLARQASPWAVAPALGPRSCGAESSSSWEAGARLALAGPAKPAVAPAIEPAVHGIGGLPQFELDAYTAEFGGLARSGSTASQTASLLPALQRSKSPVAVAGPQERKRRRRSAGDSSRANRSREAYRLAGAGAGAFDAEDEISSASDADSDETESDCEEGATARLEVAAGAAEQPSAKRARKVHSVRWGSDVKEHDGLCRENEILDNLVWGYFSTGAVADAEGVMRTFGKDTGLFPTVIALIDDLADRVAISDTDAPVLPRGGGSAAKLSAAHLSTLLQLRELVANTSTGVAGTPSTQFDALEAECSQVRDASAPELDFGADLHQFDPVSECDFSAAFDDTSNTLDVLAAAAVAEGCFVDVLGLGSDDGISYGAQ